MQPDELDVRVARAADGDSAALEELLREHGPRVRAELEIEPRLRRLLDPDDVMQVTYLEAFLRVRGLRTRTTAGFAAWLGRIANNNLLDAVRELGREKRPDGHARVSPRHPGESTQTFLQGLVANDASAGSQLSHREAADRLHAAIRRLPASYREVVSKLDLEELPVEAVAAALGRSSGAVHMLRARAHDRLRELLRDPGTTFRETP